MAYVVHGAAGAQGAPVLAQLKAAGLPVVAVGRNGDRVSAATSIVAASYESVDQLASIYRGADGVFVHLPLGSEEVRLRYASNLVAALSDARPDRVVISTSGQIIDSPGSPLQHPDGAALPSLVRGIAAAGISHAIIAARTFLENLLLPVVVEGVRKEGVLRYPIPAGLPVSWSSHLDVADVAVALLQQRDVKGVVAVGQLPPITGADLASAFSSHFGRSVSYETVTPNEFAASVAHLVGPAGATVITTRYTAISSLSEFSFSADQSAQTRLNIVPRSTSHWLNELKVGKA